MKPNISKEAMETAVKILSLPGQMIVYPNEAAQIIQSALDAQAKRLQSSNTAKDYRAENAELKKKFDALEHRIIELACKGATSSRFDTVAEMSVAELYKHWMEAELKLEQQAKKYEEVVNSATQYCDNRIAGHSGILALSLREALRNLNVK